MATRATVHFQCEDQQTEAIVYRHCDGYPESLGKDLKQFFVDVEGQTRDTRFNDPTYLAARFVVWQAARYAQADRPLAFIGVGVYMADPDDIAYRYRIICNKSTAHPEIIIERARGNGGDTPRFELYVPEPDEVS